ncbi:MAG: flagellar protein [Anaerolineaceae bacterium]|nr:MAG: flagellar protein [Anaerolineaceae bacterium]
MNNMPLNKIPSQLPVANRLSGNTIPKPVAGIPFHEILKEKQTGIDLKFSKHANERLASRNIDLTDEQYRRLETGAMRAYEKGINESLVMVDNLAFIVNIKNSTVITAVNEGEEKIFTNIDGAVII